MKRPLVALLLAPDSRMWADVMLGDKQITIREGHRDYQAGEPLMLCCHILDRAVRTEVMAVRHCTLGDVSRAEYLADGFSTWPELLTGLRRFYPNMDENSPVTVIRWGALV